MSDIVKNPRGRPRLGETVKRQALNMRTTDATRALIVAAASDSGRSITQEVEYRIARTFGPGEWTDKRRGLTDATPAPAHDADTRMLALNLAVKIAKPGDDAYQVLISADIFNAYLQRDAAS